MSIEGKHAYRFGYLKSEEWKTVRIEALAREKGKCQICGEESISNDAHHIWYPQNIYQTTERHLAILCRACHDFLHLMLPECKTSDEEEGLKEWHKFRNAIIAWRREKISLFHTGMEFLPASQLRKAYEELKAKHESLRANLSVHGLANKEELNPDQEHQLLRHIITKWWNEKKVLTESKDRAIEGNSCGICVPSQPAPK